MFRNRKVPKPIIQQITLKFMKFLKNKKVPKRERNILGTQQVPKAHM